MATHVLPTELSAVDAGLAAQPLQPDFNPPSTSKLLNGVAKGRSRKSRNQLLLAPDASVAQAAFSANETSPTEDIDEIRLESTVSQLWADSQSHASESKVSKAQSAKTRLALQAELYALKSHLAKAGRDGRWSGFLREAKIPRATADRYVKKQLTLLKPPPENCPTEAIQITDGELDKVVRKYTQNLSKRLRTQDRATVFIEKLSASLNASFLLLE